MRIIQKIKSILLPTQQPSISSEKLVSDKYKFIWIGIPKVATRSMLTALYREPAHDYGCEQVWDDASTLCQNPAYSEYFKFAFVRNPWARVVSCYLNKIADPDEKVINVIINKFPGLKPGMSFEAFVEFLHHSSYGADAKSNAHWISQHVFITDAQGNLMIDHLGKLEEMSKELDFVSNRLNVPRIVIPQLNTRSGWERKSDAEVDHHYYRAYYTDKTREMITERYKRDIELLGYEF